MAWLTKAGLTPHNFQPSTKSRGNCNTFICSNPFPNIVWHSVATTFMIYWQPKLHPTLLPRSYVASLPVLASLMYLYNATAQLPGCHDFLLDILSIFHTKAREITSTPDHRAIPCSSDSKIRCSSSRRSNFPQKPKMPVWGHNVHDWKEQQFPGHTRASVKRVLFQPMRQQPTPKRGTFKLGEQIWSNVVS